MPTFSAFVLALACSSGPPDDDGTIPEAGGSADGGQAGNGTTAGSTGRGGTSPMFPDDNGSGGMADRMEACVAEQASANPTAAKLELLVDTSTSMGQDVAGTSDSRWEVTREVMLEAVELMDDSTAVGVVFYPDVAVGADPCFDSEEDVTIGMLSSSSSAQRQAVLDAFEGQEPDGSTPTHDGYVYALERLEADTASGSPFLVLITDGEPTFALNCQGSGQPGNGTETQPLIDEAASAFERGIKTFVIGSPGSEPARESLSRMAEAGGTALSDCSHDGPRYCHFDMTEEADFAQALRDTFASIAGATLSCSYEIPPAPGGGLRLDLDRVNVLFTPGTGERETIPFTTDEECASGWQLSEDRRQVVLCENTCSRLRATPGDLNLEFSCEPRDPT